MPDVASEEKAYEVYEVAPVVTATGKTKSTGSAATEKCWV